MSSTKTLAVVLTLGLFGASTAHSVALTTELPESALSVDSHASPAAALQPALIQVAQKKPAGNGAKKAGTGKKKAPAATKKSAPAATKKKAPAPARVNTARVVIHPHGWRGKHWGLPVFGVTLGAIVIVAANTPPPPPDPSVCWTWTNDALTEGFWYYCTGE